MGTEEQGVNRSRYQVIPRCLIFLFSGESVLLLKGSPTKKIWANLYNGIGGHIEKGEDVLTAAERELFEEAGIENVELHLVGLIQVDADNTLGISLFVFGGTSETTTVHSSSEGNLEWVELSQLFLYPVVRDLPFILPKVKTALCEAVPFFGFSNYDADGVHQIRFR